MIRIRKRSFTNKETSCSYGKYLLFLFLLIHSSGADILAQRIIQVRYTQDSKGNYEFICVNYAFFHYIMAEGMIFTNELVIAFAVLGIPDLDYTLG